MIEKRLAVHRVHLYSDLLRSAGRLCARLARISITDRNHLSGRARRQPRIRLHRRRQRKRRWYRERLTAPSEQTQESANQGRQAAQPPAQKARRSARNRTANRRSAAGLRCTALGKRLGIILQCADLRLLNGGEAADLRGERSQLLGKIGAAALSQTRSRWNRRYRRHYRCRWTRPVGRVSHLARRSPRCSPAEDLPTYFRPSLFSVLSSFSKTKIASTRRAGNS